MRTARHRRAVSRNLGECHLRPRRLLKDRFNIDIRLICSSEVLDLAERKTTLKVPMRFDRVAEKRRRIREYNAWALYLLGSITRINEL